MATQIDRDPLLDQLLDRLGQQPPVQPIAAPVESTPDRPAPRRGRSRTDESVIWWGVAFVLAVALWVIGGYFTLEALHTIYAPIIAVVDWPWLMSSTALLCWLIPIGVSVLEFGSFRRRSIALLLWGVIAAFDLGSTVIGMSIFWRFAPSEPWTGADWGMAVLFTVISAGLTLIPEITMKHAVRVFWARVR